MSFTTYFLVFLALIWLIDRDLRGLLHHLFQRLELEVRCLFDCLPSEEGDQDRAEDPALEHLTDEQWQEHSRAYMEFLYGVGKYRNFNKGHAAWFDAEGLPPSPYLAHLEKQQ